MKYPPIGSPIRVIWNDAEFAGSWQYDELPPFGSSPQITYGTYLHRDKKFIIVADTISVHRETENINGTAGHWRIPIGCITSVKRMR